MLKIRLQRTGKRGQAYFKVVVLEHTSKPKGKYLELLGSYDPHKNDISVNTERVKYWLSQGAHLSETVNNLLVGRNLIEGEKVNVWKPKKKKAGTESPSVAETKPAEKTEEKKEEKEEKKEETKTEEALAPAPETPAIPS